MIPVPVKRTLLRKRLHTETLVLRAPNQGLKRAVSAAGRHAKGSRKRS